MLIHGPGLIVIISERDCEKKPSASSILLCGHLQREKCGEAGPPPCMPRRVITEDGGGVGVARR